MRRSISVSFLGIVLLLVSGFFTFASAATMTGGDATDMASADAILDIAFVIDTSGSMRDEAAGISTLMGNIITDLDCPNGDVWVRADFYGIGGTWGGTSLFDENMDYITGNPSDTITNHSEDNAPAVTDMITYADLWSHNDATASQDYYRAIVTIGDEGTEAGYPVNDADWAAADLANQAAIDGGFFIFSLAGTPYYGGQAAVDMRAVFSAMAIGGTGGSMNQYVLGDTGGTFANTTSETLETDIESIFCTAGGGGTGGGGGTNPVPEPGTILLMGIGLAGLVASRIRKKKS